VKEGVLEAPALVQLCMGVPWGAPDDLNTFMAMVNNVPEDWTFSAFSLGRNQMAYVAAAVLAGGQCARRAGGQPLARQGRAGDQCAACGARRGHHRGHGRAGDRPGEVREKLGLTKRAPAAV
jgi:uncharacterized protein (DUF849 family)